MATRTISNTGGNFNATGTWVEGVVPTSADTIVATATSGQLTVSVSATCAIIDFTNYTNTLTMTNQINISGNGTQTFVNTMTIAGNGIINFNGTTQTIVTNGKIIPNLGFTGGKTLSGDVNVVNMTIAGTPNANVGFAINCSGNFNSGINSFGGTTVYNLIGTGTVSAGNFIGTGGLNINSSGTITGSTIGIGLGANSKVNYIAGTVSQLRLKILATPITINGNGVEFETFEYEGALITPTINIPSEFKVKYFNASIISASYNPNTTNALILSGTGSLNVTKSMSLNSGIVNSVGNIQYKPFNMAFNAGVTHSITALNVSGFKEITSNTTSSATFSNIRSATPGTKVIINLTTPASSIISNTSITDIDFVIPVWTLNGGSISNSTNVSNITLSPSTGGGSWTFIN